MTNFTRVLFSIALSGLRWYAHVPCPPRHRGKLAAASATVIIPYLTTMEQYIALGVKLTAFLWMPDTWRKPFAINSMLLLVALKVLKAS